MFPDPIQILRQEFGNIGMHVVVGMFPARHTPVDQIDLKSSGSKETHQTSLGKQIIDQHIHGQRRNDDDRRAVGLAFYRDHHAIQFNEILLQRRIVSQAHQPIAVQGLERGLACLYQAGRPENPVEGIASVECALAGEAGGGLDSGFQGVAHRVSGVAAVRVESDNRVDSFPQPWQDCHIRSAFWSLRATAQAAARLL